MMKMIQGEIDEAGVIKGQLQEPSLEQENMRWTARGNAGFNWEQGQFISANKREGEHIGPEVGR